MKLSPVSLTALLVAAGVPVGALNGKSAKNLKRSKAGKDMSGEIINLSKAGKSDGKSTQAQDPMVYVVDIQPLRSGVAYNASVPDKDGLKITSSKMNFIIDLGYVVSDEESYTKLDVQAEVTGTMSAIEFQTLPGFYFYGQIYNGVSVDVYPNCRNATCATNSSQSDKTIPDAATFMEFDRYVVGSANDTSDDTSLTVTDMAAFYYLQKPGIPYYYQLYLELDTTLTTKPGDQGYPSKGVTEVVASVETLVAQITPGYMGSKNLFNATARVEVEA